MGSSCSVLCFLVYRINGHAFMCWLAFQPVNQCSMLSKKHSQTLWRSHLLVLWENILMISMNAMHPSTGYLPLFLNPRLAAACVGKWWDRLARAHRRLLLD